MKKMLMLVAVAAALAACTKETEAVRTVGHASPRLESEALTNEPGQQTVSMAVSAGFNGMMEKLTASLLQGLADDIGGNSLADLIRNECAKEYERKAAEGGFLDKQTVEAFLSNYDSIVSPATLRANGDVKMVDESIADALTEGQRYYLDQLDSIMNDETTDLPTMVAQIRSLEQRASQNLSRGEMLIVKIATTIGINASTFWHDHIADIEKAARLAMNRQPAGQQ